MRSLVGVGTVRRTLGDGLFHCPTCGGDRRYRHDFGRRHLVVLGVPVLPLGRCAQGVECVACATVHPVGVLQAVTGSRLTVMLREATRAFVAGVLTADTCRPPSALARAAAVDAVRGVGAGDYGDAALTTDLLAFRDEEMYTLVGALAVHLDPVGRAHLLGVAARVALADGPFADTELGYLHDLGGRLGMARSRVGAVLDHAARNTPR